MALRWGSELARLLALALGATKLARLLAVLTRGLALRSPKLPRLLALLQGMNVR